MASKNTTTRQTREVTTNKGADWITTGQKGNLVTELRSTLKGHVITPSDARYDEARQLFYGGFDRRPAVIARVANTDDVIRVVNLARESGAELAVRSGGHSTAGHSATQGGIVLDLKEMNKLEIDPERRTAWAETGLTAGEYTAAVDAHDLVTGFGDTASVGIGGITLGGGVGYMARRYGLTIDNLLAAEIVTADGQLIYADAEHHPDLFWAIRGGGGNFGVATRFHYKLQPLGPVYGGFLFLPATPEVIAGFLEAAEAAPEELSTIANVMPAPPMPFIPPELHGKMIVLGMLVYSGKPDDGPKVIAPFRALANPLMDMVRPMRYPEMFPPEEGDYHPQAVGHIMFVDHIGRAEGEKIIEFLRDSDAPMRVAQLRVLGGAVARVPVEATAYAHRNSKIMASVASFYMSPDDKPKREAWTKDFGAALRQSDQGAYVNFMGENDGERIRAAYPGATYERLAAVKARYDPTNLFHLNQNIKPAARK